MKKRKFYIIGIIVILFIAFFIFFQNQNKTVETNGYKIESTNYKEVISSIGTVEYGSTVAVKAEVTGTLLEINKEVGDTVNSGDIVAKIDNSKALLEYNNAKNNMLLAEARYNDYIKNYNNNVESIEDERLLQGKEIESLNLEIKQLNSKIIDTEKLVKEGALAKRDLLSLKENMELLELKLDSTNTKLNTLKTPVLAAEELKANIKTADENVNKQKLELEKHSISSPIDGIIINKNVEAGSFVQTGENIFEISSNKDKYAVVEIDEKYINKMAKDKEVEIFIESYPEESVKGVISVINPEVNKDAGTIKVKIKILEKPEIFLQNMTVRVEFIGESFENSIVIPGEYLINNEEAVYIQNENKVAVKRNISIYNKNNEKIRVLEGLKEGDIILDPANIKEGSKVNTNLHEESENVL